MVATPHCPPPTTALAVPNGLQEAEGRGIETVTWETGLGWTGHFWTPWTPGHPPGNAATPPPQPNFFGQKKSFPAIFKIPTLSQSACPRSLRALRF